MTQSTLAEIGAVLRAHQRFAILSHMRPDGDALGSQLGLALSLSKLGKTVMVRNEDGLLEKYSFLPGGEFLQTPPGESQDFDVAIALDTATQSRLGTAVELVRSAKIWINIDHHPSNPGYGDLVYIDSTAPATGQILFELIQSQGLPMDAAIAENLFVAISTDTGSFQYPNTTARTFEIAAELTKKGIDVVRISQRLYQNYPRRRIQLLRTLLRTLTFSCDDRIASFSLARDAAVRIQALPEDNEGLIDHIRAIEGVVVAVFFEDLGDGKVRVSMRSKDARVDVNKICSEFGGGGHPSASGARMRSELPVAEASVLNSICSEIRLQLGKGPKR